MKNKKLVLLILILFMGIILTPFSIDKSTRLSEINQGIDTEIIRQAAYWELNYININNNWSAIASTYDWCSGSGTLEDPYILENITIISVSIESGIIIQNTIQHFIINNCTIHNRASGIFLYNVTNGVLLNNNCSDNTFYGIDLNYCLNISVSNNLASFNIDTGIRLYQSSNCQISGNIANYNTGGARRIGVFLEESHNNTIYDNILHSNGDYGIEMLNSNGSSVLNNLIDSNNEGIRVNEYCDSNLFTENLIQNSNVRGINFHSNSANNRFYKNYFLNNTIIHAIDNGVQNHWNGTEIGNYWDDYAGVDVDINGIGDSSYSISGTADYLPIYGYPFHNGSKILIDGVKSTGYDSWQWISTRAYCSGFGIEGDPYILANLDINGHEGGEDCVKIIDSYEFFEVFNGKMYNTSGAKGIHLVNCSNGLIDKNKIWLHGTGIFVDDCRDLLLSNNEISQSSSGIHTYNGSCNTISFNTVSECGFGVYIVGDNSYKYKIFSNRLINNVPGAYLFGKAHELYNNTFQGIGITIGYVREEAISYTIDTSNTLNNKPIYYYSNKTNLSSSNFVNAGQIILANCNNSKVSDLSFSKTGLPIMLVYCYYNEISNISINDEIYGITMTGCDYNNVKNNEIKECGIGIWLLGYCDNNSFIENKFINTTHSGIKLGLDTDNVFVNNLFKDNQNYGIYLMALSDGNIIYKNVFLNNTEHAFDETETNFWDNGAIGNYWDDYTGVDLNGDGIGENPYNVSGSYLNQDKYPLMTIPYPEITILTPSYFDIVGLNPPQIDVSVQSVLLDTIWYNIDDGANQTFLGFIDSESWAQILNGTVKISIFANDSFGNIGSEYVILRKDIIKPTINIHSPHTNQEFIDPPQFNLSIQEPNLLELWYTIDDGAHNYTIIIEIGTLNQTAWNQALSGPITIRFYAQDLGGNIGMSSVIIAKISAQQQPPLGIPGYDLYLFIGALSVISALIVRKRVKS